MTDPQDAGLSNYTRFFADEAYLRESIFDPNAKIVAGYRQVMPTFRGQISEEGLFQIIAHIKSLAKEETAKAR